MTHDTDQDWLDALAGRPPVDGDLGAAREAARLREGILAREIAEPAPVPSRDARRENELIARARREGLIPSPRAAWWGGWQGAAALAAAASVVLVVGFIMRPPPNTETVRSAPGGIVRIEAANAHALQHRIVDELAAAGVRAVAYDRLGFYGIDADLPSPLTPEVERVLDRHRIPTPKEGVLKIEIAEPAPR